MPLKPNSLIPENLPEDNWNQIQIEAVCHRLISKINEITAISGSSSTSLNFCLSLLHLILGQYNKSLEYFETILEADPDNYTTLNKIGAVKAFMGDQEAARLEYQRAINIKPNYVRCLSNQAKCLQNLDLPELSLPKALDAISLNPEAGHLWSELEAIIFHQKNYKYLELIAKRDLKSFENFHSVKSYQDLPMPSGKSYLTQFEKYVLKGDVDQWIKQHSQAEN